MEACPLPLFLWGAPALITPGCPPKALSGGSGGLGPSTSLPCRSRGDSSFLICEPSAHRAVCVSPPLQRPDCTAACGGAGFRHGERRQGQSRPQRECPAGAHARGLGGPTAGCTAQPVSSLPLSHVSCSLRFSPFPSLQAFFLSFFFIFFPVKQSGERPPLEGFMQKKLLFLCTLPEGTRQHNPYFCGHFFP